MLVDFEIEELCLAGMLQPYNPKQVNSNSYDVCLGSNLLVEDEYLRGHSGITLPPDAVVRSGSLYLLKKNISKYYEEAPYLLYDGFLLGHTIEIFTLPENVCGQFHLKSSLARSGFSHALAGFIDCGFHGSLTLELTNCTRNYGLPIWPGMRIGQIAFTRVQQAPRSPYGARGRYQGDLTVTPARTTVEATV